MGHCGRRPRRAIPGLLAALIALVAFGLAAAGGSNAAVGTIFTVDTTDGTTDFTCGGASDCSFGDAIEAANANLGKDTIAFGIPGAGPHLIVLSDPFPAPSPFVADTVVIDGGTQPTYAGTPLVEIDTSGWGGLTIRGDESAGTEIRGLAIHGGTETNLTTTIHFDNPGSNVVERNFIGTDASGTEVKGGARVAVGWMGSGDGLVSSANTIADNVIAGAPCCFHFFEVSDSQVLRNLIGTDASGLVGLPNGFEAVGVSVSGERNLLSGNVIANVWTGIAILGHSSLDNRIEANLIGTDRTGRDDLGNSADGVRIQFGPSRTIVGGPDPAARNVISGNGSGMSIHGTGDTFVQGNLIGTDVTGTLDLGNHGGGIGVVGGGSLIADNVVSGNEGPGIAVGTSESVRIERNLIGTNVQGTEAIPNDREGIVIGSDGSIIGGESAAERNIISGNRGGGVSVFPGVSGLLILNNYIGTNKTGDGALGNGGFGVLATGHNTKIGQPGAGNLISGNAGAGVELSGDGAVVQGNLIGTDASGDTALGNERAGVLGGGFDPKIGGAAPGERNIISGNGGWGIQLLAGGGTSVIERNRIGTNAAGTMPLPNAAGGINMATGAPFDIVANLISGNGGDGVLAGGGLFGSPYRVIGNLIGTDASGGSDLGNAKNGVHLRESLGPIVVGGTTPDERNVISGNGENGVLSSSSPRNDIVGNYIGTDLHGANGIPNELSGVRLDSPTTVRGNVVSSNKRDGIELQSGLNEVRGNLVGVGADGSTALGNIRNGISLVGSSGVNANNNVGGPDASHGNTVAFNGGNGVFIEQLNINAVERNRIFSNEGDGVAVVSPGGQRNTITKNAIFSNGDLGIDLEDDGVTPNDAGDPDGGANLRQNFPVITRVTGGGSTIEGTLNSGSNSTYRIEIFANTSAVACDPSGSGEGERFLADTSVTTNGSGDASFSAPLTQPVAPENVITATATDADGNTSEFSQCAQVPPESATIVVEKACQPAGDPGSFNLQVNGSTLGTPANCGQSRSATLTPGTYSVSETGAGTTNLADYDSTIGGACASDGSVTLSAGQSATCTITNMRKATLTIHKSCQPVGDTGSFNLRVDGNTVGAAANCGDDRTTKLSPNTYSVSETGAGTTNLADYDSTIGGACVSDGSVTLSAGQSATCTITNVRKATLTIHKTCQPAGDTGTFNLRVDGSTFGTAASCGDDRSIKLSPNTYTVDETGANGTNLADYDSTIGGACAANGSVTLSAGQSATCTITNVRKARLTVNKVCQPAGDPGRFVLAINPGSHTNEVACGGSLGPVQLSPGGYTVSETAGQNTNLSDYVATINGACASDGSITLSAGQTATCTITNVRNARLTVNKVCQPAGDPGHFVLAINPGSHTNEVACGGSLGPVKLAPGSYTVSETAGQNVNLSDYVAVINGACAANGSITLSAGLSATCTITNSRKPRLTVTKLCPNGKQSTGDRFEVTLNGTRTGRILGVPDNCGDSTNFVFDAPTTKTVNEAVPVGNTTTNLQNYVITLGGHCSSSGSVSLTWGDNKNCTITNTRRTRSQPFTPGYWKNHRSQTVALLPVVLGNYTVGNFNQVTAIFDAMNCGASTDQSAVGCLAGHLLAAKLNVKNGSDNCINSGIAHGDALLNSINYLGPGGTYTLTSAQRTQFLAVKDALDMYNNGGGC
jgi:Right handed beta helix region/Prealbumin-like fold domain